MRRLFGSTAAVVARRWAELERLAMVTFHRDQFADEPGPSVSLALGERTTYRAGAWLLDTFERADLGEAYAPPSGFGALVIVGTGVEAASGSGAALPSARVPAGSMGGGRGRGARASASSSAATRTGIA